MHSSHGMRIAMPAACCKQLMNPEAIRRRIVETERRSECAHSLIVKNRPDASPIVSMRLWSANPVSIFGGFATGTALVSRTKMLPKKRSPLRRTPQRGRTFAIDLGPIFSDKSPRTKFHRQPCICWGFRGLLVEKLTKKSPWRLQFGGHRRDWRRPSRGQNLTHLRPVFMRGVLD